MTWIKNHLHKCDICGKIEPWLDSWSWYGSYAQQEEVGVPEVCCDECAAELKRRLKTGEVKIPTVMLHGRNVTIKGERAGY